MRSLHDRGPFHDNRIVDLSYAAAMVLGYAQKGTARVLIEAVLPEQTISPSPVITYNNDPSLVETIPEQRFQIEEGTGLDYLQVGAFSNIESARKLLEKVRNMTNLPVFIRSEPASGSPQLLHRVRLGPISENIANAVNSNSIDVDGLIQQLIAAGLGQPYMVRQ